MAEKKSDIFYAIVTVVVVLAILCIAGYFLITKYVADYNAQLQNPNQQTAPPNDQTTGWNAMSNTATGFELKFPNDFFDTGHNPQIFVGKCTSQDCNSVKETVAGAVDVMPFNNQAGEKITINNTPYLLCQSSDAAAGHTYQYYYYQTVKSDQCLVVSLVTAQTRCENYLPLETGNTEQEKNYNDCVAKNAAQPGILQQIANTFSFK